MALKQPIKTTTNASPAASQRTQLQLLDPSTFDLLPKLHELLARVDAFQNTSSLQNGDLDLNDIDNNSDIATAYDRASDFQPLNPKDLPTALLGFTKKGKPGEKDEFRPGIKDDIRDALRSVKMLPDMERAIEEQEEEIKELEGRIRLQREMLKRLAGVAKELEARISCV